MMNRRDRRISARTARGIPTKANHTASELLALAREHFKAKRFLDAQLYCRRALELDVAHVESLQLLGFLAVQANQYDAAIEWIYRAELADPKTSHLISFGTALEQRGLFEEALKAFDKAVQIHPQNAEYWSKVAGALVSLKRPDHALLAFEHALKVDHRYWFAAYNSAVLLVEVGHFDEALSRLRVCDEANPEHAPTLRLMGIVLHYLNRYEEALSANLAAHRVDAEDAGVCYNIGAALQHLGRYDEALSWYDQALTRQSTFKEALLGKASTLGELLRLDGAVEAFETTEALFPDDFEIKWNAALLHLLNGNFEKGWADREARWHIPSLPGTANYPKFSEPIWLGEEDIAGKTVLLCADEGLGDTIQFIRYAPLLAEKGAEVVLLPQRSLCSLMSSAPGVSKCVADLADLPHFDFHCPIMSLPYALRTTLDNIPAVYPFSAHREFKPIWEDRLGSRDKLRVGLVWSGNTNHKNDFRRSIPLQNFRDVLKVDVSFVSLQKDPRPSDQPTLLDHSHVADFTDTLDDFLQTAALISCLDLVISVDTSVAHLASTLGVPTWLLLPYNPDWRWLLNRHDSPWYPSMRLYRQNSDRSYDPVLQRIRDDLVQLKKTGL